MKDWAANITRWVGSTTSVLLHTMLFIVSFILPYMGLVSFERMLLFLTTIVSLEAIYLSIFIQMSINMNNQNLELIQEDIEELGEDIEEIGEGIEEIGEDIEEIGEDIEELGEDIEEIGEGIEEIGEDLEELEGDIEEIQKDVDEIQEDVVEIQEDVEEMQEEEEPVEEGDTDTKKESDEVELLRTIQATLLVLQKEIEQLKAGNRGHI